MSLFKVPLLHLIFASYILENVPIFIPYWTWMQKSDDQLLFYSFGFTSPNLLFKILSIFSLSRMSITCTLDFFTIFSHASKFSSVLATIFVQFGSTFRSLILACAVSVLLTLHYEEISVIVFFSSKISDSFSLILVFHWTPSCHLIFELIHLFLMYNNFNVSITVCLLLRYNKSPKTWLHRANIWLESFRNIVTHGLQLILVLAIAPSGVFLMWPRLPDSMAATGWLTFLHGITLEAK